MPASTLVVVLLLTMVILVAMFLLVWVFQRTIQQQSTLIQSLMKQNLTLLNQARSRDLTTLATANAMFGDASPVDTSDYESTDDRELRAAFEALKDNHEPLGEPLYDEDLEIFRSSL